MRKVDDCFIEHRLNCGQHKIGRYPVDGFCRASNTVYQFHGCAWHGHDCDVNKRTGRKHPYGKQASERLAKTKEIDEFIKSEGYVLKTMWGCEWEQLKNTNPEVKEFSKAKERELLNGPQSSNESDVLRDLKDGKLFGLVECDLHVPDHLNDKFAEMCPIFKNVEVSRQDLSEHMREFAVKADHLRKPQRMLIGSMRAEKILLFSELLKWYMEHGLVVTKVHQLFCYKPYPIFKSFGDSVTDARRSGDSDPSKALIADTSKQVGNSVYGKTITNKEKHRKVNYSSGEFYQINMESSPILIYLITY